MSYARFLELEARAVAAVDADTAMMEDIYDGVRRCYPVNQVPAVLANQLGILQGCMRNAQQELAKLVDGVEEDLKARGVIPPPVHPPAPEWGPDNPTRPTER